MGSMCKLLKVDGWISMPLFGDVAQAPVTHLLETVFDEVALSAGLAGRRYGIGL